MRRLLPLLLVLLLGSPMPKAAAATLKDFFGSYVGIAHLVDPSSGHKQERDVDIVIQPYRHHGFRLRWINVSLVNGRRDVPGVKRRVSEVIFQPAQDGDYFVELPAYNPFQQREEVAPISGDPVRWAVVDGNGLFVYSFVILPDGRYELQSYARRLTKDGLDLHFERIVDGEVLRVIDGHTVKAD